MITIVRLKIIFVMLLSMLILAVTALPTSLAAEPVSVIPRTYMLLDVSGSTANSRETLTSLYKYLFALFDTSPYEMDLTICFFDESLRNTDEIQTRIGGEVKGNAENQLYTVLSADDMFLNNTAVYDSLIDFNESFITQLSDEEKKNANIIVFSDMVSTINITSNTHEAVNSLFSQWVEYGITVKGLIWRESAKEFIFQNSDDVNKVYNMDLANKIGAYECLFHIYFDIITGGYPENYDFNPNQKHDVPVVIYPNTYEMFVITDNNQTTLKYIDGETGEYKDINATELFPAAQFSDNPPKILVIDKQQIDLIGTTFLASSVSDFQVYPIVAPQVVDVTLQQNGQSDLIHAKELTNFNVAYNPQIKLWDQNASELKAEIIITKDGDSHSTSFTLVEQSDNHEFLGEYNTFPENGEYNIIVKIKDKNDVSLSEFETSQFVTFSKDTDLGNTENSDGSGNTGNSGNTAIIVILIIIGLLIVAGGGFFLVKNKKKTTWKL